MQTKSVTRLWIHWAIWSLVALVAFLALVGFGFCSSIILGGWAVGVVLAASIILFRQPKAMRQAAAKRSQRQDMPTMSYGRR